MDLRQASNATRHTNFVESGGDYMLGHHIWDITLQNFEYGHKVSSTSELPLMGGH